MSERKQIDWEAIYREYRSGQLSNVEIAKQFGISEGAIRKRAKKDGWKRDLSDQVRKRVREKLVRDEVRGSDASDEQIIEEASERGANVQRLHQKSIQSAQVVVDILKDQLKGAAGNREDIEGAIFDETKEDGDAKRRNAMMKAVSLPTHAGVLRDLSVAMKNLIPLERQAYNLDEDGRRPDPPEEIILTFREAEVEG